MVYRYLVLMDLLVVGADIAPALLVVARSAMVGVKQSCWYLVTVERTAYTGYCTSTVTTRAARSVVTAHSKLDKSLNNISHCSNFWSLPSKK